MKTLKLNTLFSAVALASISSLGQAQPFTNAEARSLAMGDTGVASARADAAALFNPAMLAEKPQGNIQIILPNIGASYFADEDALDALENIEDENYIDRISDSSTQMNDAISGMDTDAFLAGKSDLVSAADGLNGELSVLSEKPFRINAGIYSSVAFPTSIAGFSVYANANAVIETSPIIDDCDSTTLDEYSNFLGEINDESDIQNALDTGVPPYTYTCPGESTQRSIIDQSSVPPGLYDPSDDLASRVIVAGVTVSEFGVAIAHQFTIAGTDISIGLTPKLQKLTSYWAVPTVQDLDDDNYDLGDELEASEKDESQFNADLGIATSFLPGDSLTLGLVIKNLISQDYRTSQAKNGESASYSIDRQARAGIAWYAPMGVTLAADLDLTKNKPFFLGEDTQFLSMGAEWDIVKVIKLRGGLRSNLENSDDQVLTAGVGFNIIAAHIDFAIQAGSNNAGGAFQFGLNF
ncbi:conjugal transfer protein TraF [Agaribacterium haliotis]|uniref:conjugal transfer protein TraF n=1 Tax=Agaribacterium haliotis TaxID=2013869 RepID=UPI000BB587EA|nr:conjugal transfer protein TraF [Agaribacterium haliotis]